jgi:hypothetical protein
MPKLYNSCEIEVRIDGISNSDSESKDRIFPKKRLTS